MRTKKGILKAVSSAKSPSERYTLVCSYVTMGRSQVEVARALGVSRQRVHQMVKKAKRARCR